MADITVKHYRRVSANAAEKELVTEQVIAGSETASFLDKMEAKRILRPCFETIDMRGKVPGECRKYLLNNRIFFMDDVSYGLYQQGLKENNGVYTVGVYESIINGRHTNRAIREAQQAKATQSRRELNSVDHSTQANAASNGREVNKSLYQPECVPFGYFKKRREERLQYVTAVEIQEGMKVCSGMTRDISVRGLQIVLKGVYNFVPGSELRISFGSLQEQHPEVGLRAIAYRVVESEQRDSEHQLRVQLLGEKPAADFANFIVDLIERYKRKYKLDVEDDFWSVCSWLYERIYSESFMQLSFFAQADNNKRFSVQTVAVTDGNQPFVHFFRNDVDNYDFSPLCLPSRLQYLHKEREFMLMMYREKVGNDYRIHSAADFELNNDKELSTFLRFTLAHEEHCIVKVVASGEPLRELSPRKFEMVTGRLLEKSQDEVKFLRERLHELLFTGTVVDITAQIKSSLGILPKQGVAQFDVQGLSCWMGSSRRQLPLYQEIQRSDPITTPDLIRFGYVERRREDRYLAETAVEIILPSGRIAGRTRDISKRGLSVKTEAAHNIKQGDEIFVALVSLQAKRPSLDLSKVPYRVVKIEAGTSTMLMLERMRNKLEHEIDDFFVELIEKNKHKLAVDINDTRGATLSRAYEGTASENAISIPFFIGREEAGGGCLQKVAVPEGDCPLVDFMRAADGRPDFSWLTDSRLVLALYQQIGQMARQSKQEQQRPSPIEIEVYCYKTPSPATAAAGAANPVLRVATELEFANEREREEFFQAMFASNDYRILKLMATYTLELNKLELDTAIESIRSQSKHRALKLQEQLHAIVGYGELIDMTAQVVRTRQLNA